MDSVCSNWSRRRQISAFKDCVRSHQIQNREAMPLMMPPSKPPAMPTMPVINRSVFLGVHTITYEFSSCRI